MSGSGKGGNADASLQFSWGKKRGHGAQKGTQFYESFVFDGVEYFLYDSIFVFKRDEPEPFVGKIIKIWEQPVNKKRIKVLWFFRPSEIRNYLKGADHLGNELFLASGDGIGLFNVNPLEVVGGKCNVVCTSKDKRNPQPSPEELKVADFVFYRTFNVKSFSISDTIDDAIAGVEAKYLLNWNQNQRKPVATSTERKTDGIVENIVEDLSGKNEDIPAKKRRISEATTSNSIKTYKTDSTVDTAQTSEGRTKLKISKDYTGQVNESGNMKLDEKQMNLAGGLKRKEFHSPSVAVDRQADDQPVEVTKRPETDRSKWFADLPWDARIESACDQDRLLLLDNLDPDYSHAEIEDIMFHAFKQNCSVRLIEKSTFTNPYHGQALVIFKTSGAADFVIQKLSKEILMLPNGRPLVASRGLPRPPGKKSSAMIGLLSIDKYTKLKRVREELRKAASASHYSQPNTIEYEMAMEWMYLEDRASSWWEELHEENRREIREIRSRLKSK